MTARDREELIRPIRSRIRMLDRLNRLDWAHAQAPSHVKQEVADIAILDDVILALDAHVAGRLDCLF